MKIRDKNFEHRDAPRSAVHNNHARDASAKHRLLETLVRSTTDGIIVIDMLGRVLLQNPAWLEVTGDSAIGVSPMSIPTHFGLYRHDQITPLPSEELACHRALRGDNVQGHVIFQRNAERPEGRWLSETASALRDHAGVVWGAVGVVRDITTVKRAALIQAQLAALVQTNVLAIAVLKPDGTIQDWNPGAERLTGYRADDVIGRPVSVLHAPGQVEHFARAKRALLAGQPEYTYETVALDRDGSLRDVSVTFAPVKDHAGDLIGLYAIGTDIRGRKRLEQHLAALANEERQHLGRELHDSLGQQLTGIALLTEALKEHLGRRSTAAELLTRLSTAVEEAKAQIRTIANGVSPVDIDAGGLVIALEDLARKTHREHGIECRFKFEGGDTVSVANNLIATQLYYIAREAVNNAVSHAQPRRIVIELIDRRGILVAVRDDGRGLPSDPERSGGMGLNIMRYRCGLVGGALQTESTSGGGTVIACHIQNTNKA